MGSGMEVAAKICVVLGVQFSCDYKNVVASAKFALGISVLFLSERHNV